LLHELLVAKLALLGNNETLLVVGSSDLFVRAVALLEFRLDLLIVMLDNSVVGNTGGFSTLRGRAAEEKRSLEHVVPADSVILLDNTSVEVGDEEEEGQKCEANTAGDGYGSDVPRRLLVETEVGRALVDDGKSTDGTRDQEEEGGGPDSPGNGVLAEMDGHLDEHEDDGTEAGRGGRSHTKTSEDSTETLALVPSPLNLARTSNSNTDTSDRRNE